MSETTNPPMEPGQSSEALFREIAEDRQRGAGELAGLAIDAVAMAAVALAHYSEEGRSSRLRELLRRIRELRPNMAPLTNWSVVFAEAIADFRLGSASWIEAVTEARTRTRGARDDIQQKLREGARPLLAGYGSILTLSHSSTVLDLILESTAIETRIVVCESRPDLEGRRTVEHLVRRGRQARLITDAEVSLALAETDAVLIGADTICADLTAVNKTGSRITALAAAEFGRPVIVAADTCKINPQVNADELDLERGDPGAVWEAHPELCSNITFEPVPARLIRTFLTEDGALTAEGLQPEVARWARRYAAVGL